MPENLWIIGVLGYYVHILYQQIYQKKTKTMCPGFKMEEFADYLRYSEV
jgi:hypothetical protein